MSELKSESSLKTILNGFYRGYNFKERLKHDPVEFPRRYSTPEDIEIAGFVASCFAYGKVELFKPVIEKILMPASRHPANFFRNFALKKDTKYFKGIRYRFNEEKDILCLVYMLNKALKKWGTLRDLFYHCYRLKIHNDKSAQKAMKIIPFYPPLEKGGRVDLSAESEDIGEALNNFVDFFLGINTSPIYGKNIKPNGLTQFFPMPEKGSACKRMNLFLRWMVRTKDIDLGIWNKVPPSKLIIPLDTHIAKISRCLNLTNRISSDWKTAKEITESLKKLDPRDPLKYDFALCHQGISGLCKGANRMVRTRGKKSITACQNCVIHPL